jgi:phosphatidylglycerol lysyltransferase
MTTSSAPKRMKKTFSGAWKAVPAILVLAVAAWIIARELKAIDPAHLIHTLGSLPARVVIACIVFTVASYGCLGLQEVYGLLILRRRLPPLRVVANATIANALAGVIGFGLATGTVLRLRLYRGSRLKAGSIAKLNLLMSLTNYLAGLAVLGLGVIASPAPIARSLHWPVAGVLLAGAALLAATLPLMIWRRKQRAVAASQRLGALLASAGDWIFSGSALFIVSGRSAAEFPTFLAVFCLGSLGGSLVGIPTGLGVLDAAMLSLQGGRLIDEIAAGLIVYRTIYYAGPALCAATILGVSQVVEIMRRRKAPGPAAPRRASERGEEDDGQEAMVIEAAERSLITEHAPTPSGAQKPALADPGDAGGQPAGHRLWRHPRIAKDDRRDRPVR